MSGCLSSYQKYMLTGAYSLPGLQPRDKAAILYKKFVSEFALKKRT